MKSVAADILRNLPTRGLVSVAWKQELAARRRSLPAHPHRHGHGDRPRRDAAAVGRRAHRPASRKLPALSGASRLGGLDAADAGPFLVVGVRPLRHRDNGPSASISSSSSTPSCCSCCARCCSPTACSTTPATRISSSRAAAWFFGVLARTYLFDVVDTLIKGQEHFARFGEGISDPHAASGRALHRGGADHAIAGSTAPSSPSR